MDIQMNLSGNTVNYSSSPSNAKCSTENMSNSISDTQSFGSDIIEISSQTTAFSNALSSVTHELETAKNRGYPFPPPYVTNDKQIDIIKMMIKEKMTGSLDDTTLSNAAETLWKKTGYRLDTTPSPGNTSGSGNIYNFLTKSDREELDKIYDQATADGLDAIKITRESAVKLST